MGLLYNHYEANPITKINVNAVSGTLVKTFRNSYFVRFHMKSTMAEYYFNEKQPYRIEKEGYNSNIKIDIVIIQAMLCGNEEFLVEAIDKKDYDKMFEIKEG